MPERERHLHGGRPAPKGRRALAVRGLALLLASLSAGCFTYVPASLDRVAPQRDVRLRLDPGEAERLVEFTEENTRSIEGTLVTETRDSVLLLVDVHSELQGDRVRTLQQRVQVARGGVLDVEVKQFDRSRTYLVVGGGVAALTAFAANQIFGGGDSDRDSGQPPPDESRVTLFRVRLPFGLVSGR